MDSRGLFRSKRFKSNRIAEGICCAALSIFVFVAYRDCLSLYETGDSVAWLHRYRFHIVGLLTHGSSPFHYHPLSLLWYGLPTSFFGFHPFWTHLQSLALHAANAVMVFLLARFFVGKTLYAFAAAVLFATGIYVAETVFWGGGFPNLAMTFLFLLCFFLFRSHLISGSLWTLGLFNVLFVLSLFVFPTAVNFLAVFLLYALCDPERLFGKSGRGKVGSNVSLMLRALAAPAVSVVVFLLIRSFFVEALTYNSLAFFNPAVAKGLASRMFHALEFLLIPSQFLLAFIPSRLLDVQGVYFGTKLIFILAVLGVMLFKMTPGDGFLVLWLLSQVFLVSLETDAGSRHLYSVSVGASILLVVCLGKVVEAVLTFAGTIGEARLRLPDVLSKTGKRGAAALLLCFGLFVPVKNNLTNVGYFMLTYEEASRIARSSVEHVRSVCTNPAPEGVTLLINMPTAVIRAGSVPSFVLPGDSLLSLLDLETGTPVWKERSVIGTCRELYVEPRTDWRFYNYLTVPKHRGEVRNFSVRELAMFAEQSNRVLVFDYQAELPRKASTEWLLDRAEADPSRG